MSRCPKEPLRPLTEKERQALQRIVRSGSERADVVARTREVLAVALGATYRDAAVVAGRRSAEAVAKLVARFNREGLAALEPHGRGGPKLRYDAQAQQRILAEARRTPNPEQDGTASWSLMTLRRALRRAPDGLPAVSTYTIGQVLHASGYRWLAVRSWCETGKVVRRRRAGTVKVTDPDAEVKKNLIERAYPEPRDVSVTFVPGQDRQQQGAQHIAFARRVRAGVAQRAALDPELIDARGGQELGKERQLRVRGGAGRVVPLHVDSAARRVHRHGLQGLRQHRSFAPFCFTHLVTPANSLKLAPSLACSRVTWLQLPEIG